MNDTDYRSTLECLRIAARLIMPLDLDGFLKRVETSDEHEAAPESLSIRLARIAKAMRDEAGGQTSAMANLCGSSRARHHSHPDG